MRSYKIDVYMPLDKLENETFLELSEICTNFAAETGLEAECTPADAIMGGSMHIGSITQLERATANTLAEYICKFQPDYLPTIVKEERQDRKLIPFPEGNKT